MLTVDYDRLDLTPGDLLLDLGCGFGRHAYEALARGAHVVTCDMARPELESIRDTHPLLVEQGSVAADLTCAPVNGDGTRLPFADATFDRIIASEVLEHVPDDAAAYAELARVLKPGGILAVTVPSWLPERVCWALSSDYHAPAAEGGHVRIYTRRRVRACLRAAGLVPGASHRAHALHSPYWWLRCAVGPDRPVEDNRLTAAYHRLLEWDIVAAPRLTRVTERVLNPLLGKSLVVYAHKPLAAGAGTAVAEARPGSAPDPGLPPDPSSPSSSEVTRVA